MTAHLAEKEPAAYARLTELKPLFPEVEIVTYNDDFTHIAPNIARAIPTRAFSFVLVDPKGFSLDLKRFDRSSLANAAKWFSILCLTSSTASRFRTIL